MVRARIGLLTVAAAALLTSAAHGGTLTVNSVSPSQNALAVPANTVISVTFDRPLLTTSVTTSSFRVFGKNSGPVCWTGSSCAFSFSNSDQTVTLTPSEPFAAGETVTVSLSNALVAADSSPFRPAGYAWQFVIATQSTAMSFSQIDLISNQTPPFSGPHTQIYGSMAADLNNDGWIDLTTVNEASDDLRVTLNTANGSGLYGAFLTPLAIGHEASPNDQADFDNDGNVDICIASTDTDSIWIALGNGDGTFASPQQVVVGTSPHGVTALDVDGDGDWDIVNGNRGSDDLSLLINNGSGVFGSPTFFDSAMDPNGEWPVASADMDNDGILDVVVGLEGEQTVVVLLGNGNGTFDPQPSEVAEGGPWQVALGDLNGDSFMDVTTANAGSGGSVLLGDGTGGFSSETNFNLGQHTPATDVGDLDGDGDLDWMLSVYGGGRWVLYENDGNGSFTFDQDIDAEISPSCSALLDFDNDGDLDLALTDELDDTIKLMRNLTVGEPTPTPTPGAPPDCPATQDPACVVGFAKGSLVARNNLPGYEKLIVKILKGPEIAQTDFGNPLLSGGTGYSLCIYDDAGDLTSGVSVDRPDESTCSGGATSCWNSTAGDPPGGKGYKYKDTDLSASGILQILLKGGPGSAGKSKIIIKGRGVTLPPIAASLTATNSVTVQVRGDDAPAPGCFSITLSDIKKQESGYFKAK